MHEEDMHKDLTGEQYSFGVGSMWVALFAAGIGMGFESVGVMVFAFIALAGAVAWFKEWLPD